MTIIPIASDATIRIKRDDFIRQGYDIVQAYADKYRVTAVQPDNGPDRLANFIWKRNADENGTIPLLPKHTAVRLSNGDIRIMDRNSDLDVFPVADPPVDSCPPIEPPELDEGHVLPKPFQRSDEKVTQYEGQIVPFPSPPKDTYSPKGLLFTGVELSEPPSSPKPVSPKLELVYPPRGLPIYGSEGEIIGYDNPPGRWIIEMVDQVRDRRQQIKNLFDETKSELAATVLELQKARNDLKLSVAESEKKVEMFRSVFGTDRTLKIINAKEELANGLNEPSLEGKSSSASSYYDDGDTTSDSCPSSWSSRKWFYADDHSILSPTSGKRTREETADSETEVEASILYDDELENSSPKKVRLDEVGTAVRVSSSRRSSLKRSHDMDAERRKSAPKVRFAENPRPPSSKSCHSQNKQERSKSCKKSESPSHPRRPLVRSTSRIMPSEDGGLYYVKYYPPKR